ncbi:DUF3325 domain-containing protein [Xanthomonas hortorum]|uniref:DUF3325 domain-containing protein n=1 Tax=Xanthomonas hortorum pv. gardneri TaxID=2754056 RepID=A0A6V7BUG0_9XANT|nr:DUF3325 domain-containing protein [Xanthomonas hortorum]APP82027.1 hypothetical protein BJD10_22240 [Xanthomonas hortorum pv. gardneri]EGD18704.1 hypothetical protein XGA_2674 [Xanthomonas hortorum ATCC 19865]KLA94741.1 hypothetical protein SM18210_21615 [Xanthomonas hortorum pv. gardneri]KLA95294.1 hypothetical protein SM19410_15670 [Xanthomonas hortorum pv. gardneri]KLB01587.1 hypothetical protein SM17710_04955 [Xanthomonas hortorum pv. gardneri]
MGGLMTALLGTALCHAAMMALALAMHRHYEQLTGRRTAPVTQRWLLCLIGTCLLFAALVLCVLGWGGTVGTMLWLGFLSVGALLVALGLAYAPRWSAWLALLLGCAACVVIGWRAQ